jgi:superfamily II DNA/RNA helicase
MTSATLAANLAKLKVTSLFPVQLEVSRLLKPRNNMDLISKVLNGMVKTYAAAIPILSQLIEQKEDLEQGMPWEIPGTIPLTFKERY